jgi:hypothetical protein
MGLVDRVYNVYASVLLDQAKRETVKPEVLRFLDEYSDNSVLTDSQLIKAWYVAVALYAFYVEGRDDAWKVLPEMVNLMQNQKLAKKVNGEFDSNAFYYFDENILGINRGSQFKASEYKKKGDACLVYGGFFYERQTRIRALPTAQQLRFTGKNSYAQVAEIVSDKDSYDKYHELSENYEAYERGFKLIKDLLVNN